MGVDFIFPEFEVVRNENRCIACRVCERQCANEVHMYSTERGAMISDETKCVNCQRCVSLCPTRALKIVRSECRLRENANWDGDTIREIYKQAGSGGVLLSSMGNPKPLPVYWDRLLINASQVTNPSIDPLREPMETRVFLGKKPDRMTRDENGKLKTVLKDWAERHIRTVEEAQKALTERKSVYAPANGVRKARRRNTLLNYAEEGVSHAKLEDIAMDLDEL